MSESICTCIHEPEVDAGQVLHTSYCPMSEQPITDLATAVRELGALPMPGGPEPSERDGLRAAYIAALDNAHKTHPCPALGDQKWSGCVHYDETGRIVGVGSCHSERRADAVLAVRDMELEQLRTRVAELEALVQTATEFRVWEPGYGLYVRRAPGATGFAILEARRTSAGRRAWTTAGLRYVAGLSDEELFCWPDAGAAVAEARRVLPGAVVREDEPAPEAAR
jgi:hypothetical protein